jgi:hypothetical protein
MRVNEYKSLLSKVSLLHRSDVRLRPNLHMLSGGGDYIGLFDSNDLAHEEARFIAGT